MLNYETAKIGKEKYQKMVEGWLQVQEFWEFAQKCMHRLATQGLLPGAIIETTLFEWLREF